MGASVIDQMHIVHARGTRGHARQARQAAINMFHRFSCSGLALFQHFFHQINAATRAVVLIAQQHIGWARRSAKATVNTGTQHLIAGSNFRVLQLLGCEMGLHLNIFIHAAWVEQAAWIERLFYAGGKFFEMSGLWLEDINRGAGLLFGTEQHGMALSDCAANGLVGA